MEPRDYRFYKISKEATEQIKKKPTKSKLNGRDSSTKPLKALELKALALAIHGVKMVRQFAHLLLL